MHYAGHCSYSAEAGVGYKPQSVMLIGLFGDQSICIFKRCDEKRKYSVTSLYTSIVLNTLYSGACAEPQVRPGTKAKATPNIYKTLLTWLASLHGCRLILSWPHIPQYRSQISLKIRESLPKNISTASVPEAPI